MKIKKVINLGLVLLLIATTFMGCGAKCTPKEAAEIYCEIIIKGDSTNVEKLGITKEESEKMIKKSLEDGKMDIKKDLEKDNIEISDEKLDKFVDSLMKLYAKLDYTVEEESISGDAAKVKIKCKYYNITALTERIAEEITPEFQTKEYSTEEEGMSIFMNMVIDKIIENIDKIEMSSETQEISYRFKKEKGSWVPEDEDEFGTMLSKLTNK